MINYRYGYLVERAQDARSRNDFIDTGFIIWVSNWNGPVLSLQVTSSDTLFNHDVGSYHYNFATGQELTNLDLLEYMGYTDSAKTLNALQRAPQHSISMSISAAMTPNIPPCCTRCARKA